MAKFNLFVCLCALFTAGSALELTKLCSDRLFENTTTVNAFYRLKLEKHLEPVSRYMVGEDHPNYNMYENLLSEIFDKDQTDLSYIMSKFEVIRNESVPSIRPMSYRNSFHFQSRRWNQRMVSGREQALHALKLHFQTLDENRLTDYLIEKHNLARQLSSIGKLGDDQRSIFQNKFLNVFYKKAIAQFDRLHVQRNNSIYLDDSTTKAILHFSLYIPMFDNTEIVKKNCFSAIETLPKFYTEETTSAINEDEVETQDPLKNTIDPESERLERMLKLSESHFGMGPLRTLG